VQLALPRRCRACLVEGRAHSRPRTDCGEIGGLCGVGLPLEVGSNMVHQTDTEALAISRKLAPLLKRFGDAAISHMVTQWPEDPSHLGNTRKIQIKGLSSPATYALTTLPDGKTEMCTLHCHRPPRHNMRREAPRVPLNRGAPSDRFVWLADAEALYLAG
jgi:hypothetical protein